MANEMDSVEEPTSSQANDIKRVAKDTVHKLCSAQVILSLGIAVKELVENSVDAGATVIEVKIKEYGSEGFEVVDNGSGVVEADFQAITASHHTSKLKKFADLEQINTYGFRGEALSSLCALADVSILTRHASVEYGTLLQFDNAGRILKKCIKARNVGTTVSVANLFVTLPVRKVEFQKNYRREFTKMVQLLQEYCLVLTGVKVVCTNQTKSGSRNTIIATSGSSIMDNIVAIFGAKQAQEIIKIKCPTDDGTENGVYTQESLVDISSPFDICESDIKYLNDIKFKIEGFVSDIDHKCGRNAKDRQFTYVNSRPVELKSALKSINDMYHIYNLKQFPFVFINFKMTQSNIDVNLSKDKRQVAIVNDNAVQAALKKSLIETFGELPMKFKFTSVNSVMKSFNKSSDGGQDSSEDDTEDEDDKRMVIEPNSNFAASLKQWKITPSAPFPKAPSSKRKSDILQSSQAQKLQRIDAFMHKAPAVEMSDDEREMENSIEDDSTPLARTETVALLDEFVIKPNGRNTSTQEKEGDDVSFRIDCGGGKPVEMKFEHMAPPPKNESRKMPDSYALSDDDDKDEHVANSTLSSELVETDSPTMNETFSRNIKISATQILSGALEQKEAAEKLAQSKQTSFKLKFKELIDASKNKNAEAELETEIRKDMFGEMTVIGQFNLGFIIAKLNDDLFIVDQHATDERYNFETLKQSLKIESQKMVTPQQLELTASQEETIIESIDLFSMNGFKFQIDENGLPTKRIKLISRPHSKNWEFGSEDIEELIFMLQDASGSQCCRPSRIIKMLASRACRKSVMIGDALTHKQMKKLLTHMGEIEHPWNCPHGRPTIRFLQNLSFIDTSR